MSVCLVVFGQNGNLFPISVDILRTVEKGKGKNGGEFSASVSANNNTKEKVDFSTKQSLCFKFNKVFFLFSIFSMLFIKDNTEV